MEIKKTKMSKEKKERVKLSINIKKLKTTVILEKIKKRVKKKKMQKI